MTKQQLQSEITELENQLKAKQQQLAELEAEWPREYDIIHLNNGDGDEWYGTKNDYYLKNTHQIHKTAEARNEHRWVFDEVQKIIDGLGRPTLRDWEDEEVLIYGIHYAFDEESFGQDGWSCYYFPSIFGHCLSEKFLETLLKRIGKEKLVRYVRHFMGDVR